MRSIKHPAGSIIGILALVLVFAHPLSRSASAQAPIELKFTSYVGPGHGHHKRVLEPWARMIHEKSGGRLKVVIFPGTLGKQQDQLDLVVNGIADIGFLIPGITAGRFPLTTVAELPLTFKTAKGGSRAFWALWELHLQTEWKGVKPLWAFVHSPGQLHLTRKPVRKLEDLAGLRLRTSPGMLQTATQRLGATPVVLPFPETYNGLDRGVVDGVWFPWEAIAGAKLYEVLRHHVVVDFYTVPLFVAMNERKYVALPPDLRKVIDELSGAWAAEFTGAAWDMNEQDGIAAAKKVGATIVKISDEERTRWSAQIRALEAQWVSSMEAKGLPGARVLADLKVLVRKYDP